MGGAFPFFGFGPPAGSPGASCAPLDFVLFVGATTPPTLTPDGSICAPYPTLAEAIAAANALGSSVNVALFLKGDFTGEGDLDAPCKQDAHYSFESLGVGQASMRLKVTVPDETSSVRYTFNQIAFPTYQMPIVGGLGSAVVALEFIANRGIDGGTSGAPLLEVPGIVDTAFGGAAVLVSVTGGHVVADWDAQVTTRLSMWGTLAGYQGVDFQLSMAVRSFEQCDSCRFNNANLVAALAPSGTGGGGYGFTSCVFTVGSLFTGGTPGAFVVDALTAQSYFENVGPLPGAGVTVQLEDPGARYGTYASRPVPGIPSRRFLPSDGVVEFVDTGAAWRAVVDGVVRNQIPAVASFTAAGADVTWSDVAGTISGYLPAAGGNTRANALLQVYAATPLVRTLSLDVLTQAGDSTFGAIDAGAGAGIAFRDSGTGELVVFAWGLDSPDVNAAAVGYLTVRPWTNTTTKGALAFGQMSARPKALRVTDDGADYIFEASDDGRSFYQVFSLPRLAGSDGVGPCVMRNTANTIPVLASFKAWE